jgi:CheY-like chemotaxis protein
MQRIVEMNGHDWIMIVDDNPIDQKITLQALKSSGFKDDVMVFDNAKVALNHLISLSSAVGKMPKFLLLDLDMPQMNGLIFLEQFSKLCPELKKACKIVVITASKVKKDLAIVKAHPEVVRLISKPLNANSLHFIT